MTQVVKPWGQPFCYVTAICIPYTVKKIADDAFNISKIIVYIEEENTLLYYRFNNPWLGHSIYKKELEKIRTQKSMKKIIRRTIWGI